MTVGNGAGVTHEFMPLDKASNPYRLRVRPLEMAEGFGSCSPREAPWCYINVTSSKETSLPYPPYASSTFDASYVNPRHSDPGPEAPDPDPG
jgi:hypothetical protein